MKRDFVLLSWPFEEPEEETRELEVAGPGFFEWADREASDLRFELDLLLAHRYVDEHSRRIRLDADLGFCE